MIWPVGGEIGGGGKLYQYLVCVRWVLESSGELIAGCEGDIKYVCMTRQGPLSPPNSSPPPTSLLFPRTQFTTTPHSHATALDFSMATG